MNTIRSGNTSNATGIDGFRQYAMTVAPIGLLAFAINMYFLFVTENIAMLDITLPATVVVLVAIGVIYWPRALRIFTAFLSDESIERHEKEAKVGPLFVAFAFIEAAFILCFLVIALRLFDVESPLPFGLSEPAGMLIMMAILILAGLQMALTVVVIARKGIGQSRKFR